MFTRSSHSEDRPILPTHFPLIKNVPPPPKLNRRWLFICKTTEDFRVRRRLANNEDKNKCLKDKFYLSTPTPATQKKAILPPCHPTKPRTEALLEYLRKTGMWHNPKISLYKVTQALSPLPPPVIISRDPYFPRINSKHLSSSSHPTHEGTQPSAPQDVTSQFASMSVSQSLSQTLPDAYSHPEPTDPLSKNMMLSGTK